MLRAKIRIKERSHIISAALGGEGMENLTKADMKSSGKGVKS